jgi:hypothetical protein
MRLLPFAEDVTKRMARSVSAISSGKFDMKFQGVGGMRMTDVADMGDGEKDHLIP